MNQIWRQGIVLGISFLVLGGASSSSAQDGDKLRETVITSKRFEYDAKRNQAKFEGNVVVVDERLSLRAEEMLINFTRAHEVRTIYAYGDEVLIHQVGRSAGCRVMTYDVEDGKMVLKEDAWVKQGDNILHGELIRIWRDSEKITSDSNVTFRIYMNKGEGGGSILPSGN